MSPRIINRHLWRKNRNGLIAPFVVAAVIAVVLLCLAGYFFWGNSSESEKIDPIMATVTRGEFVSQVLDQGEVQSSENVEIRCEVRARNGSLSVLSVSPEGQLAKAGDFLVQLDSTSFEKELEQQNIDLVNAETNVIQAESNLASAKATKEEFIEGTFKQEVKGIQNEIYDAESQIEQANQELLTATAQLAHSKKLQAKGYITEQTLKAEKFSLKNAEIGVQKAKLSLDLAMEKKRVLEEISFKKETIQLDADIKASLVKLGSERKSLEVEKEKLAEIKENIDKCTIRVPEGVSGQVVYAKESSRGGTEWILEEGTSVRQNQVLVRLPNPEKMEVKALINEQSITQISNGMPAIVKVDALNNTTLKGIVTKVNQYAESSGWMSSSIRKYAVFVKILDPPITLKPGMNASVTIQVQYEPDVLLAPIQTIYAVQEKQFCLLRKGEDQWETREVTVGGDNSQTVYIKDGLEEGAELVMNPGAYKEHMNLPEITRDTKIEISDEEKSQVGQTSSEAGSNDKDAMADSKAGGEKAKGEQEKNGKAEGGKKRGGRSGGRDLPANGAALIASKDSDGDGQLTKEEAGVPFTYFFDRVDTDSDGFLSESEADASIQSMKQRRQGGSGGGGGQRGNSGGR